MTTLVEARGVTKAYGTTMALRGVDLTISAGVSVGIIGESGSGKTTLLKTLLGITPPTEGSVFFDGHPVTVGGFGARPWRRDMQLVLQDPFSSLAPSMSVGAVLAEPIRLLLHRRPSRAELADLLAGVDLPADYLDRFPHQLSGGQRQRVAIARALAVGPKVLLADEPVSALDVSVRAELLEMLAGLTRDRGMTLVLISHDLGVVQRLCHRAVVLHRGHVVEEGPTARLMAAPAHPITQELVEAVPRPPAVVARQREEPRGEE